MAFPEINVNDAYNLLDEQEEEKTLFINSIIWLDKEINTVKENQQSQQQLRNLFPDVQIISFEAVFDSEEYVRQHNQDSLLVIVSGRLAQTLIPDIHDFNHIQSIYIYCRNQDPEKTWTSDFAKIRGIFTEMHQLVTKIELDQGRIEKTRESVSIVAFPVNMEGDSSLSVNGDLLQFQLLLDFLRKMDWMVCDEEDFLAFWTKKLSDTPNNISILNGFMNEYSPDRALWWYTRPTFFYGALNKALRQQNIETLLHMRFFINDIYDQLASLQQFQPHSKIRAYRGQLISVEELTGLEQSINHLVLMKSFFSTTTNRDLALFVLGDTAQQFERWRTRSIIPLKRVLFVIDADPSNTDNILPFADIGTNSYFPEEQETLFMAGCIFRISETRYDESEQIHLVTLELCSADAETKALLDGRKKHFGNDNSLITLGHILEETGRYDLSKTCYLKALDQLLNHKAPCFDERNIAVCYNSLGNIAELTKDYQNSLEWYKKGLEKYEETLPAGHKFIADSYRSIGLAYGRIGDKTRAFESLEKALSILRTNHGTIHASVAACLHAMGSIYLMVDDIHEVSNKAFELLHEALDIRQKILVKNDPAISSTLFNIGSVHRALGQFDEALLFYERSLNLKLKFFPESHPEVVKTYYTMEAVWKEKGDNEKASEYASKALRCHTHFLVLQHPNIIGIEHEIHSAASTDTDN
ncbi:unnamed protein product [Rotaria socialis]|uniref:Uncharacterized protein n=1 Tax=Rotaria socialis TaxID=392032 RepID=A0A817Y3Z2_9BILA|nr:unnamed protein product [Rotaria socialis]CAF3375778.1 unnamed protein product [Rotaria socialis]CAF3461308.1 unnamed protein product [Rotaria socialis]CAF4265162.1 unnamed protein product [Rotaria socialis]CAF4314756.1 unnamed protein product [Rotaria socialis]